MTQSTSPPRRRWTLDLSPLRRSRDLRLFVTTQTASQLGASMAYVAIPLQMARLTRSPLAVGLLGLCELAPLLVTALIGGALADYLDRRKLIVAGEIAAMAMAAAAIGNATLAHPHVWALYAIAALTSAFDGLQRPAVEGLMQRIVPIDDMTAASVLRDVGSQCASLGGPAVAGVLAASTGFVLTYAVQVATIAISFAGLLMIQATPPPADPDRPSVASIVAGLQYASGRPELMGTYAVDIIAMFFGLPTALFPFFADRLGGASILGLLYAAPSAGGLIVTATGGWLSRLNRHGLAIAAAATVWGAAIVGFGLSRSLWAALLFLAIAGAGDMVSGILRDTVWGQTIPDRLRGRLAGVEMLSYSIGPTLGNAEAGLAARFIGVGGSIVTGGIACVVGVAAVTLALPAFRRYDGRDGVRRRLRDEGLDEAATPIRSAVDAPPQPA